MPVGPVHHRRNTKAEHSEFVRFFLIIQPDSLCTFGEISGTFPGHFRAFWKLKYNKVELRLPELYRSSGPMGTITERKLADGSKAFPRPSRREEKREPDL